MNLSDDFALESVLAAAATADGLEDFGPSTFREPLGVLLDAYGSAPLNELGRMILRGGVVHSLRTRLRTNYWLAAHPEIADQRIAPPIVVVGMMRTGTTLVQRLLAADERHYSAYGWEIGEAAPRIGWQPDDDDPRIGDAEAREEQTRAFAPELFSIHPMYAHEAEEEIMFLADAFLSHVPEASADVPSYRQWLDTADFSPAYENLHRMLQLLQWQKQRRGEIRTRWILKTPAHLGYLNELLAMFGDAHVVHMHRKELIKAFADHLPGDPRKVAEAVVMVAALSDPPLRLLLGQDVLQATREKLRDMNASIDQWESVTVDVNFPT